MWWTRGSCFMACCHDVKVLLHEELCGGGTKLSSENFKPDFTGHVGYTLDTSGAELS